MNISRKLPIQISFARELRKNQTPSEEKMWEKLRNRRLLGYKFLRQHPIIVSNQNNTPCFYIADFYCAEKKLVIELDGTIHSFQIDYDKARDSIMQEIGLTVLRCSNEEVEKNIYDVLNKIKLYLRQS